jgi:hypothetical protein
VFDFAAYLDFVYQHGQNFIRMFGWEQASGASWLTEGVWFAPMPYARSGPGTALDGGPKFDLTKFNEAYFGRLRERVLLAETRGVYVSIMLFNGWSVGDKVPEFHPIEGQQKGNPWRGHPFHRLNNINGIDGDPDRDDQGFEIHTLQDPRILTIEKAYVAKVIDTVGDLDNVLYEISNESESGARDWEYAMVSFVHEYEMSRPKHHPVGMSAAFPRGDNADLWSGPADWIAPNHSASEPYRDVPPISSGGKVVLADTDHLWGVGGDVDWVWKSFLRGLNPVFMDPYKVLFLEGIRGTIRNPETDEQSQDPQARRVWEAVRRNLGYTRVYANRMNLAAMGPRPDLASTGYCMANPGVEYLIYVPRRPDPSESRLRRLGYLLFRPSVTVDLRAASSLTAEWLSPASGDVFPGGAVDGGGVRTMTAPFRGAAVLYLRSRKPESK